MSRAVVAEVRAKYPATLNNDVSLAWAVCNEVCLRLGGDWGLLAKPTGQNYNGYSIDVILRKSGEAYDILGNSEFEASPQWNAVGGIDPSRWMPPIGTVPPPPDPEPPPSGTVEDLLAAILVEVRKLTAVLK